MKCLPIPSFRLIAGLVAALSAASLFAQPTPEPVRLLMAAKQQLASGKEQSASESVRSAVEQLKAAADAEGKTPPQLAELLKIAAVFDRQLGQFDRSKSTLDLIAAQGTPARLLADADVIFNSASDRQDSINSAIEFLVHSTKPELFN